MIRNISCIAYVLISQCKYKLIFLFVIFLTPVSLYPVYAAEPLDQFAFQGILRDAGGDLITATKDITLQIYTIFADGFPVWSEEHDDVSVSNGLFTIFAGSQNAFSSVLNFTSALYLEVIIKDSDGQNAETLSPRLPIAAAPFALSASRASTDFDLNNQKIVNATNMPGLYVGKTTNLFSGNIEFPEKQITGYLAANAHCDAVISDSHMCTQDEIILTIDQSNLSNHPELWSDNAWIITGGSKFVQTTVSSDDCSAFSIEQSTENVGNMWMFDIYDGGVGSAVTCDQLMPLACCKSGGLP